MLVTSNQYAGAKGKQFIYFKAAIRGEETPKCDKQHFHPLKAF